MQSMDEYTIGRMIKELAKRLGKDTSNFTEKSMCRSADAHLAEAGMTVTSFADGS